VRIGFGADIPILCTSPPHYTHTHYKYVSDEVFAESLTNCEVITIHQAF